MTTYVAALDPAATAAGDTAWVLVSAALVLLMAPGLAIFYGGMVRSKSVLNMMMMVLGGGADQLGKQLVAAGATLVFSFVMTAIIVWVLERTIGFRVAADDETSGVDLALHAETAYDLHTTTGGRPHFGGSS